MHSEPESSADIAAGRPLTAGSHTEVYAAGNAGDGDRAAYWESDNGTFPQWIQADLGASRAVNRVRLKLPAGGRRGKEPSAGLRGRSCQREPSSVRQVFGPITPSTCKRCLRWKATVADFVFAPNPPSTARP